MVSASRPNSCRRSAATCGRCPVSRATRAVRAPARPHNPWTPGQRTTFTLPLPGVRSRTDMSTTLGHLIASPALLLLRAISGILLAACLRGPGGAGGRGGRRERRRRGLAADEPCHARHADHPRGRRRGLRVAGDPPQTELVQDLPGNTATPSLVLALLAVLHDRGHVAGAGRHGLVEREPDPPPDSHRRTGSSGSQHDSGWG